MKFKHSEPLVPAWKSGREAKKTGEICGFDGRISPWGTAGWLLPPPTLGSGALSRRLQRSPRRLFQPSLPSRAGQTGKEDEEPERRNRKEEEERK